MRRIVAAAAVAVGAVGVLMVLVGLLTLMVSLMRSLALQVALLVCQAAGVECELVFDDYDNCWGAYNVQPTGVTIQGWEVNAPESSTVGYTYPVNYDGDAVFPEGAEGGFVDLQYPGDGIMQGRYDACVGWTHTWLRQNSVEFGDAVVTTQPGGILASATTIENAGGLAALQQSDLRGYKIGYIAGWATNPGAIAYIGNAVTGEQFKGYTVMGFDTPELTVQALIDGIVDLVWFYDSLV